MVTRHWANILFAIMLLLGVVLLAVLLAGCSAAPAGVTEAELDHDRAVIAVELTKASLGGDLPAPGPNPQPSTKCDSCGGDGELGDGRIKIPCPVCGGDGVIDARDRQQPTTSERGNTGQDGDPGREAHIALLTRRINELETELAAVRRRLDDYDDWRGRLVGWLNRNMVAAQPQSEAGTQTYYRRRSLFGRR